MFLDYRRRKRGCLELEYNFARLCLEHLHYFSYTSRNVGCRPCRNVALQSRVKFLLRPSFLTGPLMPHSHFMREIEPSLLDIGRAYQPCSELNGPILIQFTFAVTNRNVPYPRRLVPLRCRVDHPCPELRSTGITYENAQSTTPLFFGFMSSLARGNYMYKGFIIC